MPHIFLLYVRKWSFTCGMCSPGLRTKQESARTDNQRNKEI